MNPQITNFQQMLEMVNSQAQKTIVVAAAEEEDVIAATVRAKQEGIAQIVYVGDADEIRRFACESESDIAGIEIVNEPDIWEAGKRAIELIKSGRGDALMKGQIGSSQLLGMLLKDEDLKARYGRRFVSHVALFEWAGHLKIFSDAGLNIAPDVEQKRSIALNAIAVAKKLGMTAPRVAFLSAAEKVNPKMPSSVEAAELAEMEWEDGVIVGGPLAFDGAMFEKAYDIKGVPSPVEGKADILICPNIETGNILYKTLAWMLKPEMAGIITGAAIPCILTSRADSARVKFLSIAATLFLSTK